MRDTRIRWADHSWNPFWGCVQISPGCDNCYAEVQATRFGDPNGFDPQWKPHKLTEPVKILKPPRGWPDHTSDKVWGPGRIFCNSMSDPFLGQFTDDQRDAMFQVMVDVPEHDYLLLTKRPGYMVTYIRGWLDRMGLDAVPPQIWTGTSIEDNHPQRIKRADYLRDIDSAVRFLSLEPLIENPADLDLDGIHWVIVGGESGPDFRPMDHGWARDIRDRCTDAGVAFYFKQSAGYRSEMGIELDGRLHEEFPFPHPLDHRGDRVLGRWTGRTSTADQWWEDRPGTQVALLGT